MRFSVPLLAAAALAMPASAATTQFQLALAGANEAPGPGAPQGEGHAELTFDSGASKVCYMLHTKDLPDATMAHIHKGAAGVAGPVVVSLSPPSATDAMASGCVPLAADVLAAIVADPAAYYVNIHTKAFPAGAVRGQLK